jgi:hypothetical protein
MKAGDVDQFLAGDTVPGLHLSSYCPLPRWMSSRLPVFGAMYSSSATATTGTTTSSIHVQDAIEVINVNSYSTRVGGCIHFHFLSFLCYLNYSDVVLSSVFVPIIVLTTVGRLYVRRKAPLRGDDICVLLGVVMMVLHQAVAWRMQFAGPRGRESSPSNFSVMMRMNSCIAIKEYTSLFFISVVALYAQLW